MVKNKINDNWREIVPTEHYKEQFAHNEAIKELNTLIEKERNSFNFILNTLSVISLFLCFLCMFLLLSFVYSIMID